MNKFRSIHSDAPIKNVTMDRDGSGYSITLEDGTGFGVSARRNTPFIPAVGQRCEVETVNFSTVTGVRIDGVWLFRLTDDDLDRERQEWLDEHHRQQRERLEANRYEMSQREAALPDWAMRRMRRFHDAGGEEFELSGWGYELHICEYAAAMVANDAAKIAEHEQQASGNTHGLATLLARLVRDGLQDEAAGDVPAGMAPLTGSADYAPVP
jgi:hypothetical protein